MCNRHPLFLLTILILTPASPATACLWDYDTLPAERGRSPSALELITGKFLRHSPEFYQWRIKDRLSKLQTEPANAGYYDDLGVAYLKTGQAGKALAILEEKEKRFPGQYETYANLGTVHILVGDFERGLPYIDKALAINPNAHFGREKYQKWLIEYAITKRRDGKLKFPMRRIEPEQYLIASRDGFGTYLESRHSADPLGAASPDDALKGILGMMRFANYQNPLLLEALGDVLLWGKGAKQLAARAYLSASFQMTDDESKAAYLKLAQSAFQGQTAGFLNHMEFSAMERAFAGERNDADKWYAELRERELGWIRDGKDADAEFAREYSHEPAVAGRTWEFFFFLLTHEQRVLVVLLCLIAIPIFIQGSRRFLRRRAARASATSRHDDLEQQTPI